MTSTSLIFSVIYVQLILIICFVSLEERKNVSVRWEQQLGSKTPYRAVANIDDTVLQFPGCTPQKIWMVVRHGTRNPSHNFIKKIQTRLSRIRNLILKNNLEPNAQLRKSDLSDLKKWTFDLVAEDHKLLTHEGEDEMLELAERMQGRFPTLLPTVYSNTTYFFKFTATQRTKASAKYFAIGLFGRPALKSIWFPKPITSDPILRFYKLCPRWEKEVKKNPETMLQYKLFETGPHMFNALESINDELNLDNELSLEDIYLMYMTCGFETARNKRKKSPWCFAIPPDTLKALEFGEDLKYYYKHGYGFEINYKQACPLFKNMVDFFEQKSNYPKATIYFTHSGTLLKFLTHLQLYKDDQHLTHSHFDKSSRKWKLGKIGGFGTNLAFVLYNCGQKTKIVVLHQEQLILLPNCDNVLCDFTLIKGYFKDSINNCIFEEMCKIF